MIPMGERITFERGPSRRGYAIGEFLCPGCHGMADIIVTEVSPVDRHGHDGQGDEPVPLAVAIRDYLAQLDPRYGGSAVAWSSDWQAHVTVSLVCQGPADPDAPDEAWNHAGETIDILATGYKPICFN
jgi:hypothetical protein